MKEFNKTQELRKIKLKQNKNTYIKRISIILSCVILLVGIIMFTFAKFESNKSYTLIQGKLGDYSSGDITLSYVVDGMSQSVPPQKGTGYKLKSINCTNADGTWDKKGWGVYVNNITGKAKCNLEFETVTEVEVTLYSAAVDEIYYYDNGEKVVLGTTDSTGKLENVALEPNDITLYSSVAKNPDNLSEDYSKLITIDDETTDVYVMPDGYMVYWYGYLPHILEDVKAKNSGSITYNTNNLLVKGAASTSIGGFFTKEPIDLSNYTTLKDIASYTLDGLPQNYYGSCRIFGNNGLDSSDIQMAGNFGLSGNGNLMLRSSTIDKTQRTSGYWTTRYDSSNGKYPTNTIYAAWIE